MAVYRVATTAQGVRIWWANWQAPSGFPGHTDIRDATDEEAALMEKVVWERDTPADMDRIKELIQRI